VCVLAFCFCLCAVWGEKRRHHHHHHHAQRRRERGRRKLANVSYIAAREGLLRTGPRVWLCIREWPLQMADGAGWGCVIAPHQQCAVVVSPSSKRRAGGGARRRSGKAPPPQPQDEFGSGARRPANGDEDEACEEEARLPSSSMHRALACYRRLKVERLLLSSDMGTQVRGGGGGGLGRSARLCKSGLLRETGLCCGSVQDNSLFKGSSPERVAGLYPPSRVTHRSE